MKRGRILILIVLINQLYHAQEQLTNFGSLRTFATSSITLFGDLSNNGTIIDSGQVITLGGTAAQTVGGSAVSTFKNLTLNNSAGASLSNSVNISGELNITSGTFSSTGYELKLLSDANGTARIAPILGNFSGNITMQRYLPTGATGWRFLASPVTGATIADWQDDFVTTGFPGSSFPAFTFTSVYSYDETVTGILDNGYLVPASASDPITPGKGFWCYIGPVPLTFDVSGPPAKFNQSFNVSYTPGSGSLNDGWVMIGNPYPSAIDWSSPSWSKTNINGAIYVWNPALQQYASWVSGTGTNGGSNIIASSQSFWVQTNAASPVLTCNENIKVSANGTYLKPPGQPTFTTLQLNIAGNGFTDETFIRFGQASGFYDADSDARKVASQNPLVPFLSSIDSSNADMSVNSLPAVINSAHVPVRVRVGASGTYTLGYNAEQNFPEGTCIVLEDLFTGQIIQPGSVYSFYISDTTSAPRFLLHVRAGGTLTAFQPSCHGAMDGNVIANATGNAPYTYTWKDMNGMILRAITKYSQIDTLQNVSAGSYYLKIAGSGNYCLSQDLSVSIGQPAVIQSSFTVQAPVLILVNDTITFINQSSGASDYTWDFGDGSVSVNPYPPVTHSYLYPGKYIVKLFSSSGNCSDSASAIINVDGTAGLSGIASIQKPEVYPNPTNGNVAIKGLQGQSRFELFNAEGKSCGVFLLDEINPVLNLAGLSKGLYLYCITTAGATLSTGKIVLD